MSRVSNHLKQRINVIKLALYSVRRSVAAFSTPAPVKCVDGKLARQERNNKVPRKVIADPAMHQQQRRSGAFTPVCDARSIGRDDSFHSGISP
jgi:hypothetical protein